jgi:glyoxylase-like metal-dependent hydrolase (beta-lactamase superfamily II)
VHPKELPIAVGEFEAMQRWAGPLDGWMILPLIRWAGKRRREAILAASRLGEPARTFECGGEVPHLPDWQCIHTDGHTPGHVAYFRPRDRGLISGDAVVTLQLNTLSLHEFARLHTNP